MPPRSLHGSVSLVDLSVYLAVLSVSLGFVTLVFVTLVFVILVVEHCLLVSSLSRSTASGRL